MADKFKVSLKKIIDEFKLESIFVPKDAEEIFIDENDVNRPGLQLMGFYEYFNPERIHPAPAKIAAFPSCIALVNFFINFFCSIVTYHHNIYLEASHNNFFNKFYQLNHIIFPRKKQTLVHNKIITFCVYTI